MAIECPSTSFESLQDGRAKPLRHVGDQERIGTYAECGVDVSAVQRVAHPTRDVLVVFDAEGDREFVGFGAAATIDFADCFIDPEQLPLDMIAGASSLITGTLGLAYPKTAAAMHRAVDAARSGPCQARFPISIPNPNTMEHSVVSTPRGDYLTLAALRHPEPLEGQHRNKP